MNNVGAGFVCISGLGLGFYIWFVGFGRFVRFCCVYGVLSLGNLAFFGFALCVVLGLGVGVY